MESVIAIVGLAAALAWWDAQRRAHGAFQVRADLESLKRASAEEIVDLNERLETAEKAAEATLREQLRLEGNVRAELQKVEERFQAVERRHTDLNNRFVGQGTEKAKPRVWKS